uniref:HIRA interacting protein 3 n=1 Tax=Gadus morhua TaxID=8049 RepID=A0A8C5BGI1_GADMO
MDHNKETQIRTFVRNLLNDAPDLSSLTLGSLKLQYMSHLGCESLSPEAKTCMKRVVGEELLNMQVHLVCKCKMIVHSLQVKVLFRFLYCKYKAMLCCTFATTLIITQMASCADSKEEEQIDQNEVKDQRLVQESEKDRDGAEEQMNLTVKPQYLEGPAGDPLEGEQKVSKSDKKQRSRKRQTKASSDEENESSSSMSDEIGEEEDKDSKKGAPGKKWDGKQKGIKEVSDTRFLVCILEECSTCLSICLMQEENKAVLRLKRYISLCGARRNYKKLFEGCGSIRSKVSVLKKELEDLGIEGLPSIDKCKKARKKLEEAKELAELDVSNIITTQGTSHYNYIWYLYLSGSILSEYRFVQRSRDLDRQQQKAE